MEMQRFPGVTVFSRPVAEIRLSDEVSEGELLLSEGGAVWYCHPVTWAKIREQLGVPPLAELALSPAGFEIDADPFTAKEITIRMVEGPPPCP